ncbi:MAG: enoyl-CoA hydratase family protein [Anaerolineales bacterium]|nr:enoyl-CoA hydratase family protein [Anaerolineales bacterium]
MAEYSFEVEDGIGTFTFSRPEVLNALTLDLYAEFRDLLRDLRRNDEVRVLIVTGEGKAFCSGGDVHEIIGALLEADMREHLEFTRMTGAVVRNMRMLDKPIIAAVNGTAAGAGAVIALASDLRVVSDQAKFAFLFTKVGLTGADMGAAYLLPRVVGSGRALELLMLGDEVDAPTAERIGLANRVVPSEEVLTEARGLAERLAAGPGFALSMTKRMVEQEWNMDLLSALEAEAQAQALMMMGEDHKAFYEAFKEKQPPRFQGR